jgi:hypothetical protein
MNCDNCKQAQAVKHWAMFQADCHGCKVRAVAVSPAFFEAIQANALTTRYRSELQANFGQHWRNAHEQVKAEFKRMKEMK